MTLRLVPWQAMERATTAADRKPRTGHIMGHGALGILLRDMDVSEGLLLGMHSYGMCRVPY